MNLKSQWKRKRVLDPVSSADFSNISVCIYRLFALSSFMRRDFLRLQYLVVHYLQGNATNRQPCGKTEGSLKVIVAVFDSHVGTIKRLFISDALLFFVCVHVVYVI